MMVLMNHAHVVVTWIIRVEAMEVKKKEKSNQNKNKQTNKQNKYNLGFVYLSKNYPPTSFGINNASRNDMPNTLSTTYILPRGLASHCPHLRGGVNIGQISLPCQVWCSMAGQWWFDAAICPAPMNNEPSSFSASCPYITLHVVEEPNQGLFYKILLEREGAPRAKYGSFIWVWLGIARSYLLLPDGQATWSRRNRRKMG